MRVSSGMTASSADRGCPATVYPASGPGNALTGKGFARGRADGDGPHGRVRRTRPPGRLRAHRQRRGRRLGVVPCEDPRTGAPGPDSPVVAGRRSRVLPRCELREKRVAVNVRKIIGGLATVALLIPTAACGAADAPDAEAAARHFVTAAAAGSDTGTCAW